MPFIIKFTTVVCRYYTRARIEDALRAHAGDVKTRGMGSRGAFNDMLSDSLNEQTLPTRLIQAFSAAKKAGPSLYVELPSIYLSIQTLLSTDIIMISRLSTRLIYSVSSLATNS